MGDCRLHVQYVGSLAAELSVPDSSSDEPSSHSSPKSDDDSGCWFVSSTSADTTLRQYTDAVLSDLQHRLHKSRVPVPPSFESGTSSSLLLYDMTLHPPRNVTPTIASHSALTGPNSKTLNQMGWFPSARLAVCYERDIGSKDNAVQCIVDIVGEGAGDEETGEYNRTKRLAVDERARMVKLTGPDNDESFGDGYRPKVSEMMAAVANRDVIGNDVAPVVSRDKAAAERAKKAAAKRKKEARRTARLDEAIRRIDEGNEKSSSKKSKTNANISAQVKKMLIKSRAVGKKSLREEDRFYVEILFVDDTVPDRKERDTGGESSSYHFFSRVAKVGSIPSNSIATTVGNDAGITVEVLVKTTKAEDNSKEYRRLPNLMALHEAEEQGYLNQFDRVVVRKYRLCTSDTDDGDGDDHDGIGSGPSKSVLDVDEKEIACSAGSQTCDQHKESSFDMSVDKNASTGDGSAATGSSEDKSKAATCTENDTAESSSAATPSLHHQISQAIEAAEASKTRGGNAKKKKKSSTSEKVRQMLIKSKAKGDKKAVKEHDRYYLEAILISENSLTGSITADEPPAPYFFNRMASIEDSILKTLLGISSKDSAGVELYVRETTDGQGDTYVRLEDTMIRLCDAEKMSALQQFSCVVVKQVIHNA